MVEPVKVTSVTPNCFKPPSELPPEKLAFKIKSVKEYFFDSVEQDCRKSQEFIDEWQGKELYKHFSESWDDFCLTHIGRSSEWIHHIAEGVKLLDCSKPVLAKDALQASIEKAKQNPLAENGEIGRGRPKVNSFDIIKAINQGGTSQEYLARRLARDNPEVLDEIGEGKKFKSLRQAAIESGIVKRSFSIQIRDDLTPEQIADRLIKKLPPDLLPEIIAILTSKTLGDN